MTSLTDTQVVTASGGLVELGYGEITSGVTVTNTALDGQVVIPAITVVCDGSPVLVEYFSNQVRADTTAGREMQILLMVDGSNEGLIGRAYNAEGGFDNKDASGSFRTTPTAGSHTFGINARVSAGTGYFGGGAGGSSTAELPSFIRVSKIVQATQWPAVTTGTIICTSSTRPASPFEGQKIYETDTNKEWVYDGTAWYSPGLQGYATVTGNQTGLHTLTNLTGASITFTAVAGRQYEVTGQCLFFTNSGDMYQQLLFRDGTTVIGISVSALIQNFNLATVCLSRIATFSAGSHTIYLSTQRQAGTGSAYTSIDPVRPDFIAIKDIGPA